MDKPTTYCPEGWAQPFDKPCPWCGKRYDQEGCGEADSEAD